MSAQVDMTKVHCVIHAASAAAAGVGAGLAQIPGSDAPVLMSIQTAMIVALAEEHGTSITKAGAAQLVLTFSAAMGGRVISQWLVGWIPAWGNAINATTAASITEAVGWASHEFFSECVPVERRIGASR